MFVPHRKTTLVYHATHWLHTTEVYSVDTMYNSGIWGLVTHKYTYPMIFKAGLHKFRATNFVRWRQVLVRHQYWQGSLKAPASAELRATREISWPSGNRFRRISILLLGMNHISTVRHELGFFTQTVFSIISNHCIVQLLCFFLQPITIVTVSLISLSFWQSDRLEVAYK